MSRVVTITGGSGFVGQYLGAGLRAAGYDVRIFDRFRSPLVNVLRRCYFGTSTSAPVLRLARALRWAQKRAEPVCRRAGLIQPTDDDLLDWRSRVAARLQGSYAVIHLAGIPHPWAPGSAPDDFRRINFDGSINMFEASRAAGVAKFIFASSAQVYRINDPVRIDQFPILETNYLPGRDDGQTMYGFLKAEFERYLACAARRGSTQAVSLRLECPGFLALRTRNFHISTSVENVIGGFLTALAAPDDFAADVFNLADATVPRDLVDIQAFVREQWPAVPNHTTGNQCLLSTEKLQRLGYRPVEQGSYFDLDVLEQR